jgi:hypothetical protein
MEGAVPRMALGHGMPCFYCGNDKGEKNDVMSVPSIAIV